MSNTIYEINKKYSAEMDRNESKAYRVPLQFPVNYFPNKPWFIRVCSTGLSKTLREKEKLLVTSNFSFSHGVFYL